MPQATVVRKVQSVNDRERSVRVSEPRELGARAGAVSPSWALTRVAHTHFRPTHALLTLVTAMVMTWTRTRRSHEGYTQFEPLRPLRRRRHASSGSDDPPQPTPRDPPGSPASHIPPGSPASRRTSATNTARLYFLSIDRTLLTS